MTKTARPLLSILLAFASFPAFGAHDTWTAKVASMTIRLNSALLADLRLAVRAGGPGMIPAEPGVLVFSPSKSTEERESALGFTANGPAFLRFEEGRVRFSSELHFLWPEGRLDLGEFTLVPGVDGRTLVLSGPGGQAVFSADHMHFRFDAGGGYLAVFNMDLRLSAEFAQGLGEPRHAGLAIGQLELAATARGPSLGGGGGDPCPGPNWNLQTDVALTEIGSVGQTYREPGTVVITPSASLKNVGTADVPWYSKFTGPFPPFNNDQHPFLVWALYRSVNGRFEQLSQSQVKHAFLTINFNCTPPYDECSHPEYSNILWPGCEDVYGQGTNSSRNSLSYRQEITAHTGIWERCGSFFDQNCDDVQDGGAPANEFERRMQVAESDLSVAGAAYYLEAWYVVRGDTNLGNSIGYRQIEPTFGGATWSFAFIGNFNHGPAIDAWVNPNAPAPGALQTTVDTEEGGLRVAVKSTSLGGGLHRYEYALLNLDFDRQIDSFSLPAAADVALSSLHFGDLDETAENDWIPEVTGGRVSWTAPPGLSLDWGTMFTFGFTATAAPVTTTAFLGVSEPGDPGELEAAVLGPIAAGPQSIFQDGFETGNASEWSGQVP